MESKRTPSSNIYTRRRKNPRKGECSVKLNDSYVTYFPQRKAKNSIREVRTKKAEGGATRKTPFIEKSRKYWEKEILEASDVTRVNSHLDMAIDRNVLWNFEEAQLHNTDFHSLLFGKQISDSTISSWMYLMRRHYPTINWMEENIKWDFLPANLSKSFEVQNTDFLRRLCPNKNLEEFVKAKLFFVPLNLGDEWHWNLLAIDYKSGTYHFYDSRNPRAAASNCPVTVNEQRKIGIARFVALVFEATFGFPNSFNFDVHFVRDCAQQPPESISCGVYARMYLQLLLRGLPLQLSWDYMMIQRGIIAAYFLSAASSL